MDLPLLRSRLRVHRLRLKARGGRLLIAPPNAVPEDLRALIHAHSDALLLDLRMHPDPPPICCLCNVLLPPGLMYICPDCQAREGT